MSGKWSGYYKPGRKIMVMRATTDPHFDHVEIDGKIMKFGKNNSFYVNDEKMAAAIDAKYGMGGKREVAMGPITVAEAGHYYTFGYSRSKAVDEFWKRYERKKKAKVKKNQRNAQANRR